jgi:hypothetical protein
VPLAGSTEIRVRKWALIFGLRSLFVDRKLIQASSAVIESDQSTKHAERGAKY